MPRYIETEAFEKDVRKRYCETCENHWRFHHGLRCRYCSYEDAFSELDRAPTADVQEVKHGHWVWDKDGMDWGIGAWVCSACHTRAQTQWSMISRNPRHFSGHQYCSVCGAKMDEKENEQ